MSFLDLKWLKTFSAHSGTKGDGLDTSLPMVRDALARSAAARQALERDRKPRLPAPDFAAQMRRCEFYGRSDKRR